jgi:hypothetical protein
VAHLDRDVALVPGAFCLMTQRARQSMFGISIPGMGIVDGQAIVPIVSISIETVHYDSAGGEVKRDGPAVNVGFDLRSRLNNEELRHLSEDDVLFAVPIALAPNESITLDFDRGAYFFLEFSLDDLLGKLK